MQKHRATPDRWADIAKDLERIWPRLERHLNYRPRAKPGTRGRPRESDLRTTAEAFLRIAYYNAPLRKKLKPPYPSPSPLVRTVSFWLDNGMWERFWRAYLKLAGADCRHAWSRALDPAVKKPFQHEWEQKQAAIRRHAYWHVMMRMTALAAAQKLAPRNAAGKAPVAPAMRSALRNSAYAHRRRAAAESSSTK